MIPSSTRTTFIISILAISLILTVASAAFGDEDSSSISTRLADSRARIDQARSEIAALDTEIATQEQYLEQNRDQLAGARMMLREAEDRYNATLTLYEQRIASIYKMGGNQFYDVVLNSDTIADAATRITYLAQISENDIKLVQRVKDEEAEVRTLHARIDELKQSKAGDLDKLKERRQELVQVIETGEGQIDDDMNQLALAEAREMDQVAMDSGQDHIQGSIYNSLVSPSILAGGNQPPEGMQPSGVVFKGVASWYGPGFHGNTTANGEVYDMFAFTAAHKTLPFNTWLKVTFNGRSVFVRINDRGPYIGGRFLDLSAASARAVGLTGIGYVTAEVYR